MLLLQSTSKFAGLSRIERRQIGSLFQTSHGRPIKRLHEFQTEARKALSNYLGSFIYEGVVSSSLSLQVACNKRRQTKDVTLVMTRAQAVRVQEVISRTRIGANKVATAEIRAQQVAPRRDVISSGNSVHVTITIASRGVPLSRDSFRKKICLSSLRAAPPIRRSKIGQKPLEMDFDRLFHSPSLVLFLPSSFC